MRRERENKTFFLSELLSPGTNLSDHIRAAKRLFWPPAGAANQEIYAPLEPRVVFFPFSFFFFARDMKRKRKGSPRPKIPIRKWSSKIWEARCSIKRNHVWKKIFFSSYESLACSAIYVPRSLVSVISVAAPERTDRPRIYDSLFLGTRMREKEKENSLRPSSQTNSVGEWEDRKKGD